MQISGPSKWLNKLKRPQGPGQLVTPPTPASPLSTFNCVLFFKYLLLSNIETISKCENARQMAPLHVRHHAHAHTYIYRIGYIYILYMAISYWVVRCENVAKARDATRPILTLHETTHYALCPGYPFCVYPLCLIPLPLSFSFVWMDSVTDLATLWSVIRYAIYLS